MEVEPHHGGPSDSFPDLGSGGICMNVRINVSWKKPRRGHMIDVIYFGVSLRGFTGARVNTLMTLRLGKDTTKSARKKRPGILLV